MRLPRGDELPPTPWLRVRRVALIRREIREFIPDPTIELLLQGAEFVFEGAPELGPRASGRAYATLMVTIDLRRHRDVYREATDTGTAYRVATLLEHHPGLQNRLEARLRDHIAQLMARAPDEVSVGLDFSVRALGTSIYIDADGCGEVKEVGSRCR